MNTLKTPEPQSSGVFNVLWRIGDTPLNQKGSYLATAFFSREPAEMRTP